MIFAEPSRFWLLLLLLPLAGLLVWLAFDRRKKRSLLADRGLWNDVFSHDPLVTDLVRAGLLTLAAAAVIGAVARPQWGFREVPVPTSDVDLLVAVDVSRSMLSQDVPPDRLSLVRKELSGLMDSLAETRVALIGFAGRPTILVPLTSDLAAVASFLDVLSPNVAPVPGTDIGAAFQALNETGKSSPRHKVAILFTDGGDLEGKAEREASALRGQGIDIFVVGVGGDRPVPVPLGDGSMVRDPAGNVVTTVLEESSLRSFAAKSGGTYLRLELGRHSLGPVLDRLHELRGTARKDGKRLEAKEQAGWFALLAALLLTAEIALPGMMRSRHS